MPISVSDPAVVLLQPRPFAKGAGSLILLPLLPHKARSQPLPAEIWSKILHYLFIGYRQEGQGRVDLQQSLLLVCRTLKDIALPLYYEYVHLPSLSSLERFTDILHTADQHWDSIRRIPYSTPGRWVQQLDLSDLHCNLWAEVCLVDKLLARLLPLVPFLSHLTLNPTIMVSRRLLSTLSSRDGNERLRSIEGVKLVSSAEVAQDDPFVEFLRCCPNLEALEVMGSGVEALLMETTNPPVEVDLEPCRPLQLTRLKRLRIISMHCSSTMLVLLHSPLPSLVHLTITPYDDTSVASSLVPRFIERHGQTLTSLHLYALKSWPTMLFPSPTTLLHACPNLNHLSLENPLPALTVSSVDLKHPLQILSIPRPDSRFFSVLEGLLPKLPSLKIVRTRDVRWLRAGMNSHARDTGVQGEMRVWRQRLARRGIAVLDADWQLSEA